MSRTNVMHMIDALVHGGAERAAVNIANLLPGERFTSHLCTTRREGPQADLVESYVMRLRLSRRGRFDLAALQRLINYVRSNRIEIIHAHGTALFVAEIASIFPPYPAIVWHVHYGREASEDRPSRMYRLAARRVSSLIAVSQPLAEWARRRLRVPPERVWYIPNFVCDQKGNGKVLDLPGESGARIVNIANFRWEKDQVTLIKAMALLHSKAPDAHLILVGATNDPGYLRLIREEIVNHRLSECVSVLGERTDVAAILRECDIGVLSSVSEGLPIALLEYGMASLPAVATDVGECAAVLDHGRAGRLVPSSSPEKLADSLLSFLHSAEQRLSYGTSLRRRAQEAYGPDQSIRLICQIYDEAIRSRRANEVARQMQDGKQRRLRLQWPFRGQ